MELETLRVRLRYANGAPAQINRVDFNPDLHAPWSEEWIEPSPVESGSVDSTTAADAALAADDSNKKRKR